MEDCLGDRRCLICRRPTPENSSINFEKLVSNTNLLQDLFNCFHINVLDSEVNDLSTSCQFCPTCEQFLAEWSSIQTQMTQLTRRATQLKATLSALLLSAPQIQTQNHDEEVTEIINNGFANSQQGQLPLWLQETFDEIRNDLRQEYSVRVMLDKIPVPSVQKVEPLPIHYDNDVDDEPADQRKLEADNCDEEYLPSEDELCNEETSERICGLRIKTEEEANSDDSNSQDSVDSEGMRVKAGSSKTNPGPPSRQKGLTNHAAIIPVGSNRFKYKGISFQQNEEDQTYTCDRCGFRSGPTMTSIRCHITNHFYKSGKVPKGEKQPIMIPDGPNRFKYNGYDVIWNAKDELYYCGVCNLRGHTAVQSTLAHIRHLHYTAEDKIKFTAVRISDTEWLYGGKYKIIKVDEKKLKCVSCGTVKAVLDKIVAHIRTQHVHFEGPEVVPLPENDMPNDERRDERRGDDDSDVEHLPNEDEFNDVGTSETILGIPSVNDSSQYLADVTVDNNPLPLVQKLEPVAADIANVDEPWDHWECGPNILVPFVAKPEPLLDGDGNFDESWDHWEFGADQCDEEYLPSEDPLNDEGTCEQILGMSFQTEEEANCDISNSQSSADLKGLNAKTGNRKTNGCTRKKEKYPSTIRVGRNRFKYNGYDVILNDGNQYYYCGVCNYKGLTTISSTLAHIRSFHYTAEDKIKFTTTRTSDTEWLYGGKYKIIKVDEKKFQCVSCGSARPRLDNMVAHIRRKHVDSECPDQAPPKIHEPLSGSNDSHDDDEPRDDLEFEAHDSEEELPSEDELNDEQILAVGIKATEDAKDSVGIQRECQSVPYTYNRTDNKFTCGLCEIQVPTWNSLSSHIRQSHKGPPKKVPCEICGLELAHKESYRKHLKRHKSGPMKCPTCHKVFLSPWNFKKHMEVHELGEQARKYPCETCDKRFLSSKDCKDHERTHTGEKPVACQICGEKFLGTGYLTRHRVYAHAIQPQPRRVIKVSK